MTAPVVLAATLSLSGFVAGSLVAADGQLLPSAVVPGAGANSTQSILAALHALVLELREPVHCASEQMVPPAAARASQLHCGLVEAALLFFSALKRHAPSDAGFNAMARSVLPRSLGGALLRRRKGCFAPALWAEAQSSAGVDSPPSLPSSASVLQSCDALPWGTRRSVSAARPLKVNLKRKHGAEKGPTPTCSVKVLVCSAEGGIENCDNVLLLGELLSL
jgi:hypothetical protein